MKKRIILYRTNAGWMARFVDDPETVRLFGADVIPTAFTKCAEKSLVVREIKRLNPEHIVNAMGQERLGETLDNESGV